MKNSDSIKPICFALLSASLYAISSPASKLFLSYIPPTMMAAFLYLGAGIGLSFVVLLQKIFGFSSNEKPLTKKDFPYAAAMVILDIAAPICLMIGLSKTTAANASLLNNFEIASTSLIAFFIFKEIITKRTWIAIVLVTISSIILSFEDISSFSFSYGSAFILLACIIWGLENNCSKVLSNKNPIEIVIIKGLLSGFGSLNIALIIGEHFTKFILISGAVFLGFLSYGLSTFYYIYAQRTLGAAKTSTYCSLSPFISVVFSLIIFREMPKLSFFAALIIMAIGTYFLSTQK
ncbi:MAG: DMT family transporter [Clostridia bacterium]|jgi:drug/metabolite transporter (DMT)-like permease|nr:DMT family transporter [Clostridia bacterium]